MSDQDNSKLIESTYETVKLQLENTLQSYKEGKLIDSLLYTALITIIIRQVETTSLKGADKKVVVIKVGHLVLKDVIPADKADSILMIYDTFANPFIDQVVEMSKNVNVNVNELPKSVPKGCCVIM